MDYLNKFVESIRFLEKFEKEFRREKIDYKKITEDIHNSCIDKDLNNFLDLRLGEAASIFIQNSTISLENLCHSVSQQFYENWMRQPIGELAPVAVTIGNVKFKGKELYEVSRSSIKRIMAKGFSPEENLELHVWLTFPNMTVLDLTIVPTLISKGQASYSDFNNCNYVIWKEGEHENLEYIPFLRHNNFMYIVDRVSGYM